MSDIIPHYPNDVFYELDNNSVACGECLNRWIKDTHAGKLTGDEKFNPNMIVGKAETPVQCDDCLKQSDDYDDLLDEEE